MGRSRNNPKMAYAVGVKLTSNRGIYIQSQNILPPSIRCSFKIFYYRVANVTLSDGRRSTMQLSARNQFAGRVKEVKLGNIMAEVVVDIGGGHEVVAAITRGSAERLKLAHGSTVTVVIKATEVLIARD